MNICKQAAQLNQLHREHPYTRLPASPWLSSARVPGGHWGKEPPDTPPLRTPGWDSVRSPLSPPQFSPSCCLPRRPTPFSLSTAIFPATQMSASCCGDPGSDPQCLSHRTSERGGACQVAARRLQKFLPQRGGIMHNRCRSFGKRHERLKITLTAAHRQQWLALLECLLCVGHRACGTCLLADYDSQRVGVYCHNLQSPVERAAVQRSWVIYSGPHRPHRRGGARRGGAFCPVWRWSACILLPVGEAFSVR